MSDWDKTMEFTRLNSPEFASDIDRRMKTTGETPQQVFEAIAIHGVSGALPKPVARLERYSNPLRDEIESARMAAVQAEIADFKNEHPGYFAITPNEGDK